LRIGGCWVVWALRAFDFLLCASPVFGQASAMASAITETKAFINTS
jgi:hypothetical protein